MVGQARKSANPRLQYIDLYCGPGCYEDVAKTPSTPIKILEHAIKTPDLRDMLITFFNDADENHIKLLRENISNVPHINKLKHKPIIRTGEVDDALVKRFAALNMVATFSLVDGSSTF